MAGYAADEYLKDSMEMILLPYAALAVAVLLLLLFSFIGRSFKGSKDRLSNRTGGKNITEMNDERLRRQNTRAYSSEDSFLEGGSDANTN